MGTGCVFCAIVKGDASAEVIYEDEETLAFMDINPATRGHTLVVPKRHFRDVYDIEEEAALAAMRTAMKVARAIKTALRPDGLNILQANEPGGFQSVFHFHFHIVPRWKDDGLVRPWEPKRGDEEEIRETARLIREQLS
ncbi:MAG: HIT family protein [Anaerolineae bacterium]